MAPDHGVAGEAAGGVSGSCIKSAGGAHVGTRRELDVSGPREDELQLEVGA